MPLEKVNLLDKAKGDDGSKFTPTPEEIQKIQEKMQDPKFVELFHDYMKSMEDPETRREEEAYLQQVEREAKEGGDYSFDFVFPNPGFVVELLEPSTSYQVKETLNSLEKGNKKHHNVRVFVNMCSSEKIDPFREESTDDRQNSNWHVPISISKPRTEYFTEVLTSKKENEEEGKDNNDNKESVVVYDAVFHPNTLQLADRSDKFCCFLVNIAVEHINTGHGDRHGFQFRRLSSNIKSIGNPQNQTITRQKGKSPFEVALNEPVLKRPTPILPSSNNINNNDNGKKTNSNNNNNNNNNIKKSTNLKENKNKTPSLNTRDKLGKEGNLPKYSITHRGHIDLTDTWGWKIIDRRIGIPESFIVKIEFTGVQSAAVLDIEVEDTYIKITKSTAHSYYGTITLPFSVEQNPIEAKFDKRKSLLTLELRVIPPKPTGITAEDMRQEMFSNNENEKNSEVLEKDLKPSLNNQNEKEEENNNNDIEKHSKNELLSDNVSPEKEEEKKEDDISLAPMLDSIGDQERVRKMMEQVQAARREREKAAAVAAAENKNNKNNKNKNNIQESEEIKKDIISSLENKEEEEEEEEEEDDEKKEKQNKEEEEHQEKEQEHEGEVKKEENKNTIDNEVKEIDQRTLNSMNEVVNSIKEEAELNLLQARQDAWRNEMQARDDDAAKKLRKQTEIMKQQEAAEVKLRQRMSELPLKNKHIFAID